MKGHCVLTSRASDEWSTPQDFFDVVSRQFGPFGIDAAASEENAKAPLFYTIEDDALRLGTWGHHERIWLNPPYSQIAAFMAKAVRESEYNHIYCLVPARTDTRWWHHATSYAADVLFVKGRLKFGDGANSAPFPSALIHLSPFGYIERNPDMRNWDWRK